MENEKKRIKAMLLALCMVVTAMIAMVSTVTADYDIGGDLMLEYDNNYQEPSAAPPDNVALIYNWDPVNGRPYYLGDQDAWIMIGIVNEDTSDTADNVEVTMTSSDGILLNIEAQDANLGSTYTLPGNIPTSGGIGYAFFMFNIDTSGTIGTHGIGFQISYERGGSPEPTRNPNVYIYISSIFDNPGSPDEHEGWPDIDETDSDVEFEADIEMQEGTIELTNYAPYTISDITGTLSTTFSPTGPQIQGGSSYAGAVEPGPVAQFNNFDFYWRFNIPQDTDPGRYTTSLRTEYFRQGTDETINEAAQNIDLIVDFTARLTARLESSVTIDQNDLSATLSVIFTNEGNVELTTIVIQPDPDMDWLDIKFHHYENDDDTYSMEYNLATLAVTASSSSQEVLIATNMMLPNGTHRVPFRWSAWYFEDGSTGTASRWVQIGGFMWDSDGNDMTPEEELLYEDVNENGMMDGGDFPLEIDWDGVFVDFDVNDANGLTWTAVLDDEIEAGRDDMFTDADVTYVEITFEIYNAELVDYKDLVVEMTIGPGTPFFDPANHAATSLMMDASSDTTILDDGYADIDFTVDVNMAWWQANSQDPNYLLPETYMVDLIVDATNNHDEVRVENVVIPAQVNVNGFGPELFANMVTKTTITPGETFTLTISIMNYGDDIAREVDAYLRADWVTGWSIVDQFVTSISSYGGAGNQPIGDATWGWGNSWSGYSQFNRTNNIKPGDIGVESVPQIVELNDWITRRESPPQGVLLWLHIDRLEPGVSYNFTFEMVSDVNMVEGMVYYKTLDLYFVDSNGETYGPNGAPVGNVEDHYAPPQQVLIRTGKGDKYVGDEMDWSVVLYALIFLIIAFIIFLIGYALGGKGGAKGSEGGEEPYQPYESEYTPPPEEPAPEEDTGPPFPEEKP